ncbi:N-acetyltransferase [Falsibacillus albus]|uniref:N-acetyltransferase n=1 Tax=Falsibacillus albus TaxID=2478915 RepID=A0A3L7K5J0_9BACI|nr:N-acetyltransferase [Falsibacillus albus]
MTIRREYVMDVDKIRKIHDEAFKQKNEGKLVDAIRESKYFIPELSLCAVTDEDELIGHIMFSTIFLETEKETVPTLGLAPMAVLPGHQHQGVGSMLVKEGKNRCRELGFKHIAVLGHSGFYPRFGFEISKNKGIEPPFPVPPEAFMVMELENGSLENLKGRVKYPKAFESV